MPEQRHVTPNRFLTLSTWRDWQRRRINLGSGQAREREAAIAWFTGRGRDAIPVLHSALRASIPIACGAATALDQLGEPEGIRCVLQRCYNEEWLARALQNGHLAELHALRCLGNGPVSTVLAAAFDEAARTKDGRACQQALIVALSALRLIAIFDDALPSSVLKSAMFFGPASLSIAESDDDYKAICCLAAAIRMEAVTRLQYDYGIEREDLLIQALRDMDPQVVATAIDGLGLLSARKALPYLHKIAFGTGHPLAMKARRAIERIVGGRSEALTLMRAAQPPIVADELLRAANGERDDDPETLVRTVTS
jgi:hypothetical protein